MPGSNPPATIPQEVRASPPAPTTAMAKILRPPVIRASRRTAPETVQAGLRADQRVPVASIFHGAPLMVQVDNSRAMIDQANPAGLAVRPMNGLSAASNVDTSVSAQARAKKQLTDMGVPVSGDYTDAIRQAAGFAFGPKRMPKQGYAAASYSYPAQQMVVGATLSGTPIVNQQPTQGVSPNPPRLVTRAGSVRGQISSSPSEERRRLLSTLQGLGALAGIDRNVIDYTRLSTFLATRDAEGGFTCKDTESCKDVKIARVKRALREMGKNENDERAIEYFGAMQWSSVNALKDMINKYWGNYTAGQKAPDGEYASGFLAQINRWVIDRSREIGAEAERRAREEAERRAAEAAAAQTPPGGATNDMGMRRGRGFRPDLRRFRDMLPGGGAPAQPPQQPAADSSNMGLIIGGAAALVVIGVVVATRR